MPTSASLWRAPGWVLPSGPSGHSLTMAAGVSQPFERQLNSSGVCVRADKPFHRQGCHFHNLECDFSEQQLRIMSTGFSRLGPLRPSGHVMSKYKLVARLLTRAVSRPPSHAPALCYLSTTDCPRQWCPCPCPCPWPSSSHPFICTSFSNTQMSPYCSRKQRRMIGVRAQHRTCGGRGAGGD
jgi:hypothetical protein